MVGAIHGRLLTAWSTAGVLGPVLVNYIREYQLAHGVAREDAYSITMFVLAGLLAVGFVCNLLVKPVDPKHYMTQEQLDADVKPGMVVSSADGTIGLTGSRTRWIIPIAWAAVWIPILWGVWMTLQKAAVLFK
jgi:hypothetical protein